MMEDYLAVFQYRTNAEKIKGLQDELQKLITENDELEKKLPLGTATTKDKLRIMHLFMESRTKRRELEELQGTEHKEPGWYK